MPLDIKRKLKKWHIEDLIHYSLSIYHKKLGYQLSCIDQQTEQLVEYYSISNPEVIQIDEYISKLRTLLNEYWKVEKEELYQPVLECSEALSSNAWDRLTDTIISLRYDHAIMKLILDFLRDVSGNYYYPAWDTRTYLKDIYTQLQHFDAHLSRFLYFERYVVFPVIQKVEVTQPYSGSSQW